ncbi:MAG: phage holin family protein [Micrococcales bacterium]
MIRFLVSTVINALGLWVVTAIIPGILLHPYGGTDVWPTIGSYLLIGAIFGLVNAIIAPVIKILAFPLYILTFGLISLVINGALLLLVAWLSNLIHDGNGLTIEGFTTQGLEIGSMGIAILGALVLSVFSFIARWFMKVTGLLN